MDVSDTLSYNGKVVRGVVELPYGSRAARLQYMLIVGGAGDYIGTREVGSSMITSRRGRAAGLLLQR